MKSSKHLNLYFHVHLGLDARGGFSNDLNFGLFEILRIGKLDSQDFEASETIRVGQVVQPNRN